MFLHPVGQWGGCARCASGGAVTTSLPALGVCAGRARAASRSVCAYPARQEVRQMCITASCLGKVFASDTGFSLVPRNLFYLAEGDVI